MNLQRAIYVQKDIEPGWPIMSDHIPLGKEYVVDLDQQQEMTMIRTDTGQSTLVTCIYVVSPGEPGWIPLVALRLQVVKPSEPREPTKVQSNE